MPSDSTPPKDDDAAATATQPTERTAASRELRPDAPGVVEPALPRVIGRYEVVRLLGEGAMGRVLLAHDKVLDREVAIKHLRADLAIPRDVRAALVKRMQHEARAAARVPHPNLVVLHDMGEDPLVGLFLVFEFVDGPTLKERLLDGPLLPVEVARLARELGAALTCAHSAGVLHRDVKPENVMLSKAGAKMADFGIARVPDSTLTHQGGLLGTPAYSAPETFASGAFSPASDQFSLAATVYEAASGLRAFPGDDAVSVAAKIRDTSAPRVAESAGLPREVDDVLARALERVPGDRFPSCESFGGAFARAVLGGTGEAESGGESARSPPTFDAPRERKLVQVLIGGAVVVVTATLLVRAALRSLDGHADEAQPALSASATAEPTTTAAPAPSPSARHPKRHAASAAPSASAAPASSSSSPPVGSSSASPPASSSAATPAAASASAPAARASAAPSAGVPSAAPRTSPSTPGKP